MSAYTDIAGVRTVLAEQIRIGAANATITPGSSVLPDITEDQITSYIKICSGVIDGRLRAIYDVPLIKINQGGEIDYPAPIPYICSILTACYIFNKLMQGNDREVSSSVKELQRDVESLLINIANGDIVLQGIRYSKSSRFVNNGLYGAPKNPTVGNKTEQQR